MSRKWGIAVMGTLVLSLVGHYLVARTYLWEAAENRVVGEGSKYGDYVKVCDETEDGRQLCSWVDASAIK